MTQNKKNILIIIVFVFLPFYLAYLNATKSNIKKFSWGYDRLNEISTVALIIGILACAFIIYGNYKGINPKSYWYSIPIAIGLGLGFILFVGNSLSNLGF